MQNIKVSVIIPFYNGASWLSEAIESVLSQTHDNFEIFVINDGSPEDVSAVLEKYGGHINYFKKDNGGPASARNLALSKCTGDFIAFLDSDDVWLPEKTEKQISFMLERNLMWSHTGYYNWFPEENKLVLKSNSHDYGDVYKQSFVSLRASTPAIIIKHELFKRHPEFRFFEDMRYSEDSLLWSKISYHYPLGLLTERLIKVRQRGVNADLLSLIRFESKRNGYAKIMAGEFKKVPKVILFIYRTYLLLGNFLRFMERSIGVNKRALEFIGKVFWVLPFVMERVYLFFITYKKDKDYIK